MSAVTSYARGDMVSPYIIFELRLLLNLRANDSLVSSRP